MMVRPIIDVAPVLAMLGGIPPAVAGALSEANYDLTDYHKRTVLKQAGKFPGRRGAQKYLAARLFSYGRKRPDPTNIEDVQGESFGVEGGERSKALVNLEEGADIDTSEYMTIPVESGTQERKWGKATSGAFGRLRNEGSLFILYRKGKPALLISRPKRGEPKVYAVLLKHRHQRKLLDFYAAFNDVWSKKESKYGSILELAMTESGRQKLATQNMAAKTGRDAFSAMRTEALRNGLSFSEAKKVAKAASEAAKRLVRSGGGRS